MILRTGITKLENLLLDFLFASVLSGILGNALIGILFEVCYMTLRIFAGGYHASTPGKCLWFTYGSTCICMVFIFMVPLINYIFAILILIFDGIIFVTTPIQSENKPLCNMEKRVYHRNSVCIALAETVLFPLLIICQKPLYAKAVFMSMALVAVGLLAGVVKRKESFQ
ncbi:MAG: accessory gene regulator B family protein [Roseburia sp.]|nr:accessory gene regulator B family protein [Roseburia sp.]